MKVVLDTNVLVSGLLCPPGAPAAIVRLVSAGILNLCYDGRVLSEYRRVLRRPRFHFEESDVTGLLADVVTFGLVVAPAPLEAPLPHAADEPFLAAALAGGAHYLVTGNLRHYPADRCEGVRVVSPAEFLSIWQERAKRKGNAHA